MRGKRWGKTGENMHDGKADKKQAENCTTLGNLPLFFRMFLSLQNIYIAALTVNNADCA